MSSPLSSWCILQGGSNEDGVGGNILASYNTDMSNVAVAQGKGRKEKKKKKKEGVHI